MDPSWIQRLVLIHFFITFAALLNQNNNMTQKEIVIMVLKKLGGRGTVEDICVLAKHYIGDSSNANSVDANIRRELNSNPDVFRHPEGVIKGEWELVDYSNELKRKDEQIEQLIAEIDFMKSMPTAADVELNILKEVMNCFKHNRSEAGPYRYLLEQAGCKIAVAVLDVWMSKSDYEIHQCFNIDNTFEGPIEHLLLKHADVVAGIAEKGSNVFHHIQK